MAGKNKAILQEIGKELKQNPPKVVQATERKFGVARAQKQKKAILLSKARKAGGGVAKVSGGY